MAEQFRFLEAEFGIPFMADNIGGFKIRDCEWLGHGSSGGGAPTPVAGTPTTEILTSKRLLKVLISIVVLQVLKALLSPTYGSMQSFCRNG
jgi:hypothetical protein